MPPISAGVLWNISLRDLAPGAILLETIWEYELPSKVRSAINSIRILNAARAEKGLPTLRKPRAGSISKEQMVEIAVEVWRLYPQALRDPDYQLGELTLDLVEQEIAQRISDLRRGVKVRKV